MHTIGHDIRCAIRTLFKQSAFTFVAIVALSLTIGANTAIFSAVNALLVLPLTVEDASYFPARAAMRLNPVEGLRHERTI
jgi:ABC-type lipoprotein release transport system permease subunit